MFEDQGLHRRRFLVGTAGAVGALTAYGITSPAAAQDAKPADPAAAPAAPAPAADAKPAGPKPLPPYASWKNADAMIVHTNDTIEMKRGYGGTSVITPNSMLYVRNNIPAPDAAILADRDAWSVAIEGVKEAKSFTVGELKAMGVTTVASVLQCSGNGRSFFEHKPSGTKWNVGAAGCVLWSGVPLKSVVEAAGGMTSGMKFITSAGGETLPDGVDPKTVLVERSVPVAALKDAILAWEMNGEPIPLAHGGPLRIVLPGYHGVNNIKYVKRVAFTEAQSDAKIQKSGYRMHGVDAKGAPDQPSMWEMPVKSWVTSPLKDAKSGKVVVTGVAFGGINAVKGVEVSVDGGKTWKKASFVGPDLGQFAWRQFAFPADLKAGSYRIVSRATDSKGAAQPEDFPPNGSGYGHNGWKAHGVDVTVA